MSVVLVVNSGSSSFKYQLIEMTTEETLASGLVERIGEETGRMKHTRDGESFEVEAPIPDHPAGFSAMIRAFGEHGPSLDEFPPVAVGHRVVHGGKRFFAPTVVTDLVKINIEDLADLAPLHNPANLEGIEAAQKAFPDVTHVAVFDTAFHHTISDAASSYALPIELAEKHRIRRYGFHGTSHKFVSEAAAAYLGRRRSDLKTIVLHLGNGASACAVDGGASVETSMGMTPLEGLVMGTRSGDLDPAVVFHLVRKAGLSIDDLDALLNRRSGLLGLSGRGDMRDVQEAAEAGNEQARAALDVYYHRLRHYIGAYYAQLGRVDAIVFTAGVGENVAAVRTGALHGLEGLGIELDHERNIARDSGARRISTDDSRVAVLVIPTNEELEIARQCLSVV
ncbi:acetate/propionate family kinase [Rathayibacter iranicus]|uniref:Acetate kinase n=2 Tax=Rathayibacter iranicus TaxID=59737 RepID=A0AAD1AHF6_9MICO|nr:acetate kinase [Rathayibacter iranicus]AZZ57215.1 acetate kinase [Rathayibacter iranicus]MWV29856.1 acetate/propionate family kinase [Rathayibacter iranicus NCPPB 2253 = VKM Ac-1602]PPI41176.1 acetate kinase [Rathayibacter iranicus]PPI57487.1 acetate kinase [Rathayibacter iranicus]PPI68192.1 acetate kinase [Rathayibacter iranicus]